MENPCLTFVTPTLLAGDRSLANVVAHEIAHSWTGGCWCSCLAWAGLGRFWAGLGWAGLDTWRRCTGCSEALGGWVRMSVVVWTLAMEFAMGVAMGMTVLLPPAGNLVTNSSWESFWLNEGFTVFLERKILGRLYGEQVGWRPHRCGVKCHMVSMAALAHSAVHTMHTCAP